MAEMDDVLAELRHRIMGQLKPARPQHQETNGEGPAMTQPVNIEQRRGLLPSRCAALLTLSEMAVLSWRSRYPSRSTLSEVALPWGVIQYPHWSGASRSKCPN
jgi:hypothetical protein